jgi:hypothetical protein
VSIQPVKVVQQIYNLRSALRWLLAAVAATLVAAIPTRLSMHDLAVGLPFTWHTRQEIVTLGEQPNALSLWLLLLDIALVLGFLIVLRLLFGKLLRWRAYRTAR